MDSTIMMRIGELARRVGVDVETIRYYEREGLIPAPERGMNGYRRYGMLHLQRLAFVRHCRALDMSLAEVRTLLDFIGQPAAGCQAVDALVDAQLVRVRARIASMRALETQLSALRQRCTATHTAGDCGILNELVAAAHGEACACHTAEAHTAGRKSP